MTTSDLRGTHTSRGLEQMCSVSQVAAAAQNVVGYAETK